MLSERLESIGEDLYRRNPFRVLGVHAHATQRDITRRFEKAALAARLGVGQAAATGLLPLDPAPDEAALRAAHHRLTNPVSRFLDELFWFWPEGDADPTLEALENGDQERARSEWLRRLRNGPGPGAAEHNLAVLAHACALDLELITTPSEKQTAERSALWEEALRRWLAVLVEDRCWVALEARVGVLASPEVNTGAVSQLRNSLVDTILFINAKIAVQAILDGRAVDVTRHANLIATSGMDGSEAARRALSPVREKINSAAAAADQQANAAPTRAVAAGHELIETCRPLLGGVDALLARGQSTREVLHDAVARSVHGCCYIAYQNPKPEDVPRVLELLELCAAIAEGPLLRDQIAQSLATVQSDIDAMATMHPGIDTMCWFCELGIPDPSAAVNVQMYGNVTAEYDPVYSQTNVRWEQANVPVPRCADCQAAHRRPFSAWRNRRAIRDGTLKPLRAKYNHPAVVELFNRGFEIGAKPTTAEQQRAASHASWVRGSTEKLARDVMRPQHKVNINRAMYLDLQQLPGIGPEIAAEIIAERDRRGGFRNIADLTSVRGIGAGRLAQLTPYIEV
jgi:competence ComEA-like helix-hairpin-helix protein